MSNAAVFRNLNLILIGIVGANVQVSPQRLLATHAVNIWSFLVAKLVYFLALEADARARQQNQANYTQFWSFIAYVLGSVSSLSLVSTFVPRPAGYIILCAAWNFAAITIAVYQYGSLFVDGVRWVYYEILKPFFSNTWNRIKANNNNNNNMLTEVEQQRASV